MKKCILIAPKYFGYENKIECALRNHFDEVVYIDERLGNSTFLKTMSRLSIRVRERSFVGNILLTWKEKRANRYYNSLIQKISDADTLICIIPETIPNWFITKFKNLNPDSKTVLYMWDSFKNRPYAYKIMENFDKVFTFDSVDSSEMNIQLLPLFYSNEYSFNRNCNSKKKYQFSFIGTAHSDRYFIASKLNKMIGNNGFVFLFLQSKLQYFFLKITNLKFRGSKISDFSFDSMSTESVVQIVNNSSAILDIQHPNQVGLTMRTIEIALGMRKKLITTNSNIKTYDFYNENNILIIERENIESIEIDFFDRDYLVLEESIYEKYCIDNWVNTLIK